MKNKVYCFDHGATCWSNKDLCWSDRENVNVNWKYARLPEEDEL